MHKITNQEVARVFDACPAHMRRKLLALRELIFRTAAATEGVGELEETLKWGEPAYLTSATGSGSTIRIAWKKKRPNEYAIYFNCQTSLVADFRTLFPNDFRFEGQRALVFHESDAIPRDALQFCIAAALTRHRSSMESTSRTPKSVDEYIAAFSPDVQSILRRVRQVVRDAAPQAQEVISYRMPALKQHGILVYFAAFKAHIGLYPPVAGDARLLKALAPYAGEKGNLRFPFDKPIPYPLIARITALRVKQDLAKAASGRPLQRSPANGRQP
jgi:uncharacterized protein YdhG (YjbR/CyaY superfamily)